MSEVIDHEKTAAGYRYRSERLDILHTTSVPRDDEEALEYFSVVNSWFPRTPVSYVERRDVGDAQYHLLQWEYKDGKAERIVSAT